MWLDKKHNPYSAGTSRWFYGCFSHVGSSVKPPPKMNSFDNMTLCLLGRKLVGGLAFMTIFPKIFFLTVLK